MGGVVIASSIPEIGRTTDPRIPTKTPGPKTLGFYQADIVCTKRGPGGGSAKRGVEQLESGRLGYAPERCPWCVLSS